MKARRGRKTAGRLAAAAAAVLVLAGAAPASATAAQAQPEPEPTYRCLQLERGPEPYSVLGQDCEAFHGAPLQGPVYGRFRIESNRGAVHCEKPPNRRESGFAALPDEVVGWLCDVDELPGGPGDFPGEPARFPLR
ncbi:hypothetical protein [Streptomyces sp. NPDC093707]|uniref:hypothetical protein n=1 Tax=Streptomyces sp. NPDC093707 TaxID=3154984 RepID=UPI00344DAF95